MRSQETLHSIHAEVMRIMAKRGYELTPEHSGDPDKPHVFHGRNHKHGFDVHLELPHWAPDDIAECALHRTKHAKDHGPHPHAHAVFWVCQKLNELRFNHIYCANQ